VVVDLDDSRHVVAGVIPPAAALEEEQHSRDQGKNSAGDSDVESPVEHDPFVIEADIIVLMHESAIHSDANSNADSWNTPTEYTY